MEYVMTIVLLSNCTNYTLASRLLQVLSTGDLTTVIALLITVILVNYIMNTLYMVVFWKYLRQLIGNQQIDYISHGVVLFFAMVLNYRFGLLALSKMFPKPNINVDSQTRLTPVHYLCIVSIILSVILLTAGGIVLYN